MKKIILTVIGLLFISSIINPAMARGRHYDYYKSPRYSYSTGRTHNVRTHFRSGHGVIVGHRAGNPGSGVHCHNNICS